ncbi:helix-turn-helix domain-containing protein [Fusobacterium ulcerans]|uniref:helix-turn-helix domain-containing protein n=1 Tax=Fusobacterium ulcerans TaxID=861 RepID=UPI002E79050B|nr:helix-turn-helix domain-containing protein [Fusobacterium ulcerans]MEE0140011.1 helix-turn-helix domain-containing protein [Fusobacterium ulcerans]
MIFGKVLKEIRTKKGDSLRKLGEKTGVVFTYIDKIEKGEKPINSEILSKLIKEYPLNKKELVEAYTKEMVPDFVVEEIKKDEKADDFISLVKVSDNLEELYNMLFKGLELTEQKEILNTIVERLEVLSYKKGQLEENKDKIEKIKETLKKLN